MNPVLIRRLLGAGVLLMLLFVLSLLLPAPSDPKPAEPGMRRIEVAVDDAAPIELPTKSAAAADNPSNPPPRRPDVATAHAADERLSRSESATVGGVRLPADPPPDADGAGATEDDDDAAASPDADVALAEQENRPAPRPAAEPAPKPKLQAPLPTIPRPPAPAAPAPKPAAKPVEKKPAASAPAPKLGSTVAPAAPGAGPAAGTAAPRWAVQAGSYADVGNARQVEAQLKSLGLAGSISLTETGGSVRYRVRSGPYASREAAEAARQRMQQNRITANVVADGP